MAERIERQALVPPVLALKRFDQAAAELFPEFSRSRLQAWIKTGELSVDGKTMKPREKLKGGESLRLNALVQDQVSGPENIDLEIVHEDASLLVINKPAGMIVHPGAGNAEGTLMNALLYHDERLATLPRAGIVHRLDKETTGLLVVARTLAAHHHLGRQFSDKTAGRVYEAIVYGRVNRHGRIEAAIGRHPVYRTRMGVRADGRLAVTHYDIVKCFDGHTHLRLNLETGRTHQIRVHLQHIRHPIVGDPVYGGGFRQPPRLSSLLEETLRNFGRQALHAKKLYIVHPETQQPIAFESPLPEDMRLLIEALEQAQKSHE